MYFEISETVAKNIELNSYFYQYQMTEIQYAILSELPSQTLYYS